MAVGGKPLTLTLTANPQQNRLAGSLPFVAQAIKCDNYTGQWLWLAEANDFIPPYYTDRIIILPDVNSLTVICLAPPGYVLTAPVAGQIANFTPYAEFIQPASGVFQPPSASQPATVPMGLESITSTAAQASTVTIDMPLQGLGLIYQPSSGVTSGFGITSEPSGVGLTPVKISDNGAPQGQGRLELWVLLPSAYAENTNIGGGNPSLLGVADTQLQLSVQGGGGVNPTAVLQYYALGSSQLIWNAPERPLAANASINPSTLLTNAPAIGSTALLVQNSALFTVGGAVNLHSATDGHSETAVVKSITANQINVDAGLIHAYAVGDTVMALGIIGVFGQPIQVQGTPTTSMRVYERPYDGIASNPAVGAGAVGSCQLAGQAGKAWTVGAISAVLAQTGATAASTRLQLIDGVTVIREWVLAVGTTNGDCKIIEIAGLAIPIGVGNLVKLAFNGNGNAGVFQSVNLGAWLN